MLRFSNRVGANSNCLGQLAAELMAHLAAETGAATKVGGPALFGMGPHHAAFRRFLNSHFQPAPASGISGSGGSGRQDSGHSGAGNGVAALSPAANGALFPSSSSEPGSPQRALPMAGKALSADIIPACPTPERQPARVRRLSTPSALNLYPDIWQPSHLQHALLVDTVLSVTHHPRAARPNLKLSWCTSC